MWIVVGVAMFVVIFGLHGYASSKPFSSVMLTIYAALHRTIWAVAIAALVFLCFHGYGGEYFSLVYTILNISYTV